MRYGLPYKGSKNKIAKQIIDALPSADTFVDVFAGGCAITHAALLSGKYKRVIANDVDIKIPMLFKDAINGNLPADYDRFISREKFNQLKDYDAIVACCWSFGNNKEGYLWNDDTAGAKSIAFRLVMSGSRDERGFAQLVCFFELACAISGYMSGVNPFDQPGVEAYKKNMFKMLGKPTADSVR